MVLYDSFGHILRDCFTGTGVLVNCRASDEIPKSLD